MSGTGEGGKSVFGSPIPDKIHRRLRYRGMLGVAQPKKLRRRNYSQKPGENLGCTGVERYRLNEETRGGMPGIYMIYMREGVIFTCSTYFHLQA